MMQGRQIGIVAYLVIALLTLDSGSFHPLNSISLISGNRIEIRGFGSFEIREYEGHTDRNPKTGLEVVVKDSAPVSMAEKNPVREMIHIKAHSLRPSIPWKHKKRPLKTGVKGLLFYCFK